MFRNILLLFLCSLVCRAQNTDHARGFIFLAPKRLLADSLERVCLTLHNVTTPASISLDLLHSEKDEKLASAQHRIQSVTGECLELYVPATQEASGRLRLRVTFEQDVDYTINSIKPVQIQHDPTVTFIETDKAVYKPGQAVRFRVLTLRNDLKPVIEPIHKIWIENPSDVRIIQWLNVSTELGIVELTFPLSQEPMMGKWKIKLEKTKAHLSIESTTFEVKKYVLPRFEVKINYDENILADTETIKWIICARYSYGQPVQGTLHLKTVPETPSWRMWKKQKQPEIHLKTQLSVTDGCHAFNLSGTELGLREWELAPSHIILTASVEEEGTGHVENATVKSTVLHQELKLDFVPYAPSYFKPGLPYTAKLHVSYTTGKERTATNETIQLCLHVRGEPEWRQTLIECKNFTTDNEGFIEFSVPPQHKNVDGLWFSAIAVDYQTKLYSQAKRWRIFMDQPTTMFNVKSWYSPSGSYLELITDVKKAAECGKPLQYHLYYTVPHSNDSQPNITTFFYMIKSRGDLIKSGTIQNTGELVSNDEFKNNAVWLGAIDEINEKKTEDIPKGRVYKIPLADIDVTPKMSPISYLLVYYTRADGEVVATSTTITIKECLANKIKAHWQDTQQYPGEVSTLILKAAPRSLCSVSVVDKSTSFMAGPTTLTKAQVFNQLGRFEIRENSEPLQVNNWDHCSKLKQLKAEEEDIFEGPIAIPVRAEPPLWDMRRRKRSYSSPYPNPQYADAIQAFDDFGVVVISDLVFETRPCKERRRGLIWYGRHLDSEMSIKALPRSGMLFMPAAAPPAYLEHAPDRSAPIRTFFPETWLWELVPTGLNGEAHITRSLPHTITDWMTSVACVSPQMGLGIAHKTHLRAFQPFFLDYVAPYSIKRGEVLHLKVIVFNYLEHDLPVRINLGKVEGVTLVSGAPENSACIAPHANFVHDFQISASLLGKINITVLAEVDVSFPGQCGPEFIVNHRDVIVKPILVQPEGFPVEIAKSAFICVKDAPVRVVWDLILPIDLVRDSARAKVSAIADLLGPALQNLDKLVKLPMGCGEQNMILFVPNLHVINYLNATGSNNEILYKAALINMKKGYQRELNYRHPDGSYSAFGTQDAQGSMWLTAFVVRSFAVSRYHIYVDEADLKHSMRWIVKKQLENGCFPTVGTVFHKEMKGGLTGDESNTAALTAYVLISLLETGFPLQTSVTSNAKYCLAFGKDERDPYTMALITYALTLLGHQGDASESLVKLIALAKTQDDLMWWENDANPSLALSIETTAYVILSLLNHKTDENLMLALKAVRWMSKHRNSQGGFVSTQDTIVALEALAKYASALPHTETNVHVQATAAAVQHNFTIREVDRLVLKQLFLPQLPTTVELLTHGKGCLLLQGVLRYNIHEAVGSDAFGLEVQVEPKTNMHQCTLLELSICTWYRVTDDTSNMAVLEVTMVTGYEPVKDSLQNLLHVHNTNVKRVEEDKNKVNFYFSELNNQHSCVSFEVDQKMAVDKRVPAVIRVYDYYHPELEKSMSYKLEPKCREMVVPHREPMDDVDNMTIVDIKTGDDLDRGDSPMLPEPLPLGNASTTDIAESEASTVLDDVTKSANILSESDTATTAADFTDNLLTVTTKDGGEQKRSTHYVLLGNTRQSLEETSTGLNEAFVDLDMDLETPDGVEGPSPTYAIAPGNLTSPSTSTTVLPEQKGCPNCYLTIPDDFTTLYCTQKVAYKISLKNHNNVKILYTFAPFEAAKKLRATVKLHYGDDCHCPALVKRGSGHVMIVDAAFASNNRKTVELADNTTVVTLGKSSHVFAIDLVHGAPQVVLQARNRCDP